MYSQKGVAESISELLKLVIPLMGVLALAIIISSVKSYGLLLITNGTEKTQQFLNDGQAILNNP